MKMWIPQSCILRQYLIIITVNLSNLCLGFGIGWPSPAYVKLRNDTDLVLSRPITEDEGSWLVSITFLSITVCVFPAAYLADYLGRKLSIIMSSIPQLIACFLYLFGTEVWMLLFGRFLIGVSISFLFTMVPTYSAEIASKEIRGTLGTIFQVSCAMGIFLSLCIGPFVSYITLNLIYTAVTVILAVPLVFLPESPYFLYSKGQTEESRKVLLYIRRSKIEVESEIIEYNTQIKCCTKFTLNHMLKNTVLLKTFWIILIVGAGGQLSGFNTLQSYLQTILESTETNIKSETASAVIGFLQILASFCTSIMTDRFGRKPIMICTFIGMSLGLGSLGMFFKLKDIGSEIKGVLNILPLVTVIVIMFCYSAGHGSICFILTAELFEGPARAIGVSFAVLISAIFVFITSKYFVNVISAMGAATTYWMFSGNCILTALFIAFCVPETKGKTFEEIQRALGARKVLDDSHKTTSEL